MGEETRAGPSWPALALVTVTAIAASGVASAVWTTHGDRSPRAIVDPAAQLVTVEEACERWTDQTGRPFTSDGDRCAALTGWLSDALTRTGRSPWMLWGDPEKLHTVCLEWLAEGPPADLGDDDGVTWCGDLVGWMADHVGSWKDRDGWDGWLPEPMIGP
ncbi:hypothetical protein [Jiangella mangrovi]|uniref:Uncharacterized protein n=1 Tax=Jiangella mangrovi TaxID=1524084 RepID=A0A7W9GME8_9ACTN|nr:hypothetical protein [Jiangella mangrovi]MBB5786367.1 hypothetical protein [Jiangella mangrovi]